MTEVFVDTSYWLALLHPGDGYHPRAKEMPRPARMVTTVAIQLEVMDAFSAPPNRGLALQFWQITNSDSELEIVPLNSSLLERGVALFQSRPDKGWSVTDCISFVVMKRDGMTDALTGDHHFEQAGFVALLK